MVIGGFHRKISIAHTKLCASRTFLLAAYPTQSHEMISDPHTRASRVFGSIPRRGIYDHMKTAVNKVGVGKRRIWQDAGTGAFLPECGRELTVRKDRRVAGWLTLDVHRLRHTHL